MQEISVRRSGLHAYGLLRFLRREKGVFKALLTSVLMSSISDDFIAVVNRDFGGFRI